MNFFFKSDDAHTSAVDDTLQYFNAALGSMDPDDDVGIGVANSGVRPKGPLRGGRKKKHKKTSRWNYEMMVIGRKFINSFWILSGRINVQLVNQFYNMDKVTPNFAKSKSDNRRYVLMFDC